MATRIRFSDSVLSSSATRASHFTFSRVFLDSELAAGMQLQFFFKESESVYIVECSHPHLHMLKSSPEDT